MKGYHNIPKGKKKAVLRAVNEGMSMLHASKRFRVSYQTVRNWHKKAEAETYLCAINGCVEPAVGVLRGKWLCQTHRSGETQAIVQEMNQRLANGMGVEVVAVTPIAPIDAPETPDIVPLTPTPPPTPTTSTNVADVEPARDSSWESMVDYVHRARVKAEEHGEGVKYDQGKPRMDLIDPKAMIGLAKVLSYGARKYSANNWRNGMDWSRIIGAAERHIASFKDGENDDPETMLHHVDHAMCCLMFLSNYLKTGTGTDDRWKAVPSVRPYPSTG